MYAFVLDVILKTHGNPQNNKCTEKEVLYSIGVSLTNSKDWDGHRNSRLLKNLI